MKWLCFAALVSQPAWAQRDFAFTWSSATLGPSDREMQTWVTPRSGREDTSFMQVDLRFQSAQGLSQRVDVMYGFDVDLTSFGIDSRAVDARVSSTWRYSPFKAAQALGFSVLSRFAAGATAAEVELRLVFDKQFGPLLLALNVGGTRTVPWYTAQAIDTRFEQSLGIRYQVEESFSAGLEVRAREALAGTLAQGTAVSAGPSFTYVSKRWWLALGLQVQTAAYKAKVDRSNAEPLEVRDNERFVGRVSLGVKL